MNQLEIKYRGETADGQIVYGNGVYQSHGQLYIVDNFTFVPVKRVMRLVGCDEQGRELYDYASICESK